MVSEESYTISTKLYQDGSNTKKEEDNFIPTEIPDDIEAFIKGILDELCEKVAQTIEVHLPIVQVSSVSDAVSDVVSEGNVVTRSRSVGDEMEKQLKVMHRRTSVLDEETTVNVTECVNSFVNVHRRAVSECIIDENDNNIATVTKDGKSKDKKKKRLSFNTIFGKKDKTKTKETSKEEEETHDNLPQLPVFFSNTLGKTKKYASAMELHQKNSSLQRTPSFIKRLVHMGEDSSNFLKRSLSFRDFSKKSKDNAREKLSERKAQEWKQSLQSLVETDISVSYNDLSFVNYDALNDIHYEPVSLRAGSRDPVRNGYIGRTQSMIERSPEFKRPAYQRILSTNDKNRLSVPNDLNLNESTAAALSLPSLLILSKCKEDAPTSESTSSIHKRRPRPHSTVSDDGFPGAVCTVRRYSTPAGDSSSFGSTGSGSGGTGAKLRRHNATRQKVRSTILPCREARSPEDVNNDRTVRSRSLTHLDNLEMRPNHPSSSNDNTVTSELVPMKDSRSEPDCTRTLATAPMASQAGAAGSAAAAAATAASAQAKGVQRSTGRRNMLSRLQKSSSECFSVNFEVGDESTWENELFFPAQRGVTLHDALAKQCELRNIDLSLCEARLQDKESNAESILSLHQDTACLVGRHVRIIGKESSNKKLSGSIYSNHSRKQSGSNRSRTTSFFSSSTEEAHVASSTLSLHDGDQNKKQIKQRLTAFFGNTKDTKYEALIEQLDKYSKQGIPNVLKYPQGQCESIDALYRLEDDWRDIIDFSDMSEKQQQQQTALWELIKTEVAYIKTLKVVTDLFLACLKDLQPRNLLKEIDTDKLFSNITEILDANVVFWRNTLFPLVRDMRRYRRSPCIETMLEGFRSLQDVFQPYYKYCAEQSRCQHYCRENMDSEVFTAYLTWCESQKECNRLRLMDILVQPMQRLTKYGLLLKAILKNTDEDVERENLQMMIKMVDEFVNNVNSSLKHRQDKERLKGIIARIESYDIVESKDDDIEKILKRDRSLTSLDLTRPMLNCPVERKRHLLLEGDLKLKDSSTSSKMEVHCFLLTDMLLICKPSSSTKKSSSGGTSGGGSGGGGSGGGPDGGGVTMRVVRQPYLVDRLTVIELPKETPSLALIYRNEFDMAVQAFIVQSQDARKIKGWRDGIAKAQALYAQAKQTTYTADESVDTDYSFDYNVEGEYGIGTQLIPRSPLATSSRASRVSSLAHSHSGSVEMNDQSSMGSATTPQSRAVSVEAENRTGSVSSDEGVQSLPPDQRGQLSGAAIGQTSGVGGKTVSFKNRLLHKTPNTLSVQPYGSLGQSLPNLTLGSPNIGVTPATGISQNTLSVPGKNSGSGQLLSPTHRGVSYPPPSPTRGNLRRSLAISANKNPPLIKTRQVNSASTSASISQNPTSFDFDVPVIAGVSQQDDDNKCELFSRGQHRQAMKRSTRYYTAGIVDDIKKQQTENEKSCTGIHKRLSWNCQQTSNREHT